jgi:7-cyano-7-deazaguanine synthase
MYRMAQTNEQSKVSFYAGGSSTTLKKRGHSFIIRQRSLIMSTCVVLFSGGLDSTTALFWAIEKYETVQALTFDYGQRHRIEITMSQSLTRKIGIPHRILKVDLAQIGGSALTDLRRPVPGYAEAFEPGPPLTYVPFRNGIFISLAAAWAEVEGIQDIVCGFNVIDSPDYPDTRQEFVEAMEKAINLGTKASSSPKKFRILAPFVNMKKSEIIRQGLSFGADFSYSVSCYSGQEVPCEKCSSCVLRRKAWEEVGQEDPLILRLRNE